MLNRMKAPLLFDQIRKHSDAQTENNENII